MSFFKPPTPTLISFGGSSGPPTTTIGDTSSSVVATTNTETGDSIITISTNNTLALTVDNDQNIKIGTDPDTHSTSKLTVASADGDNLKLINSGTNAAIAFVVNTDSGLTIDTTGSNIKFGTNKIYIGQDLLYINQNPVLTTAQQLNYNQSTPGVASASKTLIVDENRDIININSLSASSISGVLTTAAQPNINSLNSVNINTLSLNNTTVQSTASQLNYLFLDAIGNARASKSMVLDANKNFAGVNTFHAVSLNGTLLTPMQPNITEIGTLDTLFVDSFIGVGTTTPSKPIEIVSSSPTIRLNKEGVISELTINADGNLNIISQNNIAISGHTDIVFSGTSSISGLTNIICDNISGIIQTQEQPNITSIGSLENLDVTNDVIVGSLDSPSSSYRLTINESNGAFLKLIKSLTLDCSFDINNVGDLVIAPTSNIRVQSGHNLIMAGAILGISDLSATTLTGAIQTAAQPNITSIGTLSSLSVTNDIIAESIISETLTGSLQTALQPNITAVGTLTSLNVLNAILAGTISASTLTGTLQTAAQSNITAIGTLSNLNVTNLITADNLIAAELTGTIITSHQPNINSIGRLTTLSVTNGISAESVTATELTGTIQTTAQPNITSIGTLNSLTIANAVLAGSVTATTLSGTIQTANQPNITTIGTLSSLNVTNAINASAIIATTITGALQSPSQTNITAIGTLNSLLTSGPIGIGTITPQSIIDIDTSLLSASATINITDGENYGSIALSSNGITINTNGPYLTLADGVSLRFLGGGVVGLSTITATEITGTIQTAAQPNITSIGVTQYLDSGFIGLGDVHSDMYRMSILDEGGKMITMSDGNIAMILSVVNGDYTIITSNNRLAFSLNHNLVFNGGTIIGLDELTVNNLAVNNLTGTIQTSDQPNITSLGALTSAHISGDLTVEGELILATPLSFTDFSSSTSSFTNGAVAVSATDGGTVTITGGAAVSQNLIIGTHIAAPQLRIGNTSNSEIPIEIGFSPFTMTSSYAYNTQSNAHGVLNPGAGTSYNYSIRALGRILCTQSVDVMSDRRTKKNITPLSDHYCSSFIEETNPVSFNWVKGESHKSFGYIAQDILRAGFTELVNLVQDETTEELIEDDGFISPAGVNFTVTYQHIIPILAQNQKRLMRENEELKTKLDNIIKMLQAQ